MASRSPTTNIAGGMGARPQAGYFGRSYSHDESLNTPAEALEYSYRCGYANILYDPAWRRGKHRGGDGIVREIEVLTDAEVTLLSDRRLRGPWGLLEEPTVRRGTHP